MRTKKILVTGIGGNVGQGILRNIRDSFANICLVGVDILGFTSGNYLCDKTYQVPYSFKTEYIPTIQDICLKENIDLIIPSTDYEVFYLSKFQEEIPAVVAASDYRTTERYLDKYKSYLHHKKYGVPFAISWLPREYDYSEKEIIAKPREGRGSRGILLNPEDIGGLSDEYVIQQLLKGRELTTAVYVTKKNLLHGIFTMERELTNGTTSKSKVVFEYDEQLRSIAKKMISLGGLKGAFNIQSIITTNGRIVPFEVNCRISGTNSIRHNLGFKDVIYTVQEYLYDETPSKPNPISGIATRIFLDIIYPEADNELKLNNRTSQHRVY